jgi:hypothetical protein
MCLSGLSLVCSSIYCSCVTRSSLAFHVFFKRKTFFSVCAECTEAFFSFYTLTGIHNFSVYICANCASVCMCVCLSVIDYFLHNVDDDDDYYYYLDSYNTVMQMYLF